MKKLSIHFNKTFLMVLVVGLNLGTSFADNAGWHFKPGIVDPNSQFHVRFPQKFQDDITSDQDVAKMTLTTTEQHQALVWGLSVQAEKRYVALMQNQSGFFYGPGHPRHQMTPVEVLGANARNNEERDKYATLDAEQQFQYLAKYLAYLADYNRQARLLKKRLQLPIIRPFNYAKFSPYHYQPISLKPQDQLMLFVTLNNAVRPIVSSLMASIEKEPSIVLNVYFVGKNVTQSRVERWARGQNIPPTLVAHHQITLNFDQGKFASLNLRQKLPLLIRLRHGVSQLINTGGF